VPDIETDPSWAADTMSQAGRLRIAIRTRTIILDAAMGTRLMTLGLSLDGDDPALWNLTRPEVVAAIHRRDRRAGADALTTNTFGANHFWLDRHGRADRCEAINRRAVSLAREAAGTDGFVIGDVGPTGLGKPGAIREQVSVLIEAGVDALLFETFQVDQAEEALHEAAGFGGVPILVSLFDWPDAIAEAAGRLIEAGADVLGMNCRPGMANAVEFAERIRAATDAPLLVKPSAAEPEHPDREAASFAAAVARLQALGVRLIGGCCGTTEDHVAALRNACYAGSSR
jgi:methionine synthase I (cobalamin-dependent)